MIYCQQDVHSRNADWRSIYTNGDWPSIKTLRDSRQEQEDIERDRVRRRRRQLNTKHMM